ncbi:hypothetical protein [Pseudaestuariivita rosea]|uniref:hypothetical protein n=1 Tax=Pseudaestuariivita rosea TaxID=2763263 RepID=UPI001ABA307E|nr:hypothetical protein [Pseudaestuariivita rosea]
MVNGTTTSAAAQSNGVGANQQMDSFISELQGDNPNIDSVIEDLRENVDLFDTSQATKTYYVSPDGDDSNPGTAELPWKTISYAMSAESPVSAGERVLVQEGTYTEIVTIEKSGNARDGHIILEAEDGVVLRDPILNDTMNENWHEGNIEAAGQGYLVIDGFRIEESSFAGVAMRDANDVVIQNIETYKSGGPGIIAMPDSYFDGGEQEVTGENIRILNNTVIDANNRYEGRGDRDGQQEAISVWGVDGFEVAGNLVNGGNREGIDAKVGARNGSIHDNFVTGVAAISGTPAGYQGGPAIYIDGNRAESFNIDVYQNVVFDNTADAIAVADEQSDVGGGVRDIRIYDNLVMDNGIQGVNGGVGLFIGSNVDNVTATNNTFVENVQGIVIDGSDNYTGTLPNGISVTDNAILDSTYRNAYIDDVRSVTFSDNLISSDDPALVTLGSGTSGVVATGNTSDPSELGGGSGGGSGGQPGERTLEPTGDGVRTFEYVEERAGETATINSFDLNSSGTERTFDTVQFRVDGQSYSASTDAEMIALIEQAQTSGSDGFSARSYQGDLIFDFESGSSLVLDGIAGQLDPALTAAAGLQERSEATVERTLEGIGGDVRVFEYLEESAGETVTIEGFDLNSSGTERTFDTLRFQVDGQTYSASTDDEMIALIQQAQASSSDGFSARSSEGDLIFDFESGSSLVLDDIANQLDPALISDFGI